jgi:hypothetical protein
MKEKVSIENLPSVDSKNQKHLVRYVNFINSRPERELHQKGFHTHHIYPKSIAKKNDVQDYDGDWNLIELTPREHFIAHLILWKCGYGEMISAFRRMVQCKKYKEKLNSKTYENLMNDYLSKLRNKVWVKNDKENLFIDKNEAKFKVEKRGYKYGRFSEWWDYNKNAHLGKENGMWGRTHTDEVKSKLKKLNSIKSKNSKWMNNGVINKFVVDINQQELLDLGFVYGRINQKPTNKNTIIINNGSENKFISKEELDIYIEKGYTKGSIPSTKRGTTRGKVAIHKDDKVKFVLPEKLNEFISNGWIKGQKRRK